MRGRVSVFLMMIPSEKASRDGGLFTLRRDATVIHIYVGTNCFVAIGAAVISPPLRQFHRSVLREIDILWYTISLILSSLSVQLTLPLFECMYIIFCILYIETRRAYAYSLFERPITAAMRLMENSREKKKNMTVKPSSERKFKSDLENASQSSGDK